MVKTVNSLKDVSDAAIKEYYKTVLSAFESHGFSQNWLTVELFKYFSNGKCRIARNMKGTKDYWYVDGKIIFSIEYKAEITNKNITVTFTEREEKNEQKETGKA